MKAKTKKSPAETAVPTPELRLIRCEIKGPDSIKLKVRGAIPENPTELVTSLTQFKKTISAVAVKVWERLTFTKAEVIKGPKDFSHITVAIKKEVLPIEELPSIGISHTEPGIGERLRATNRIDAAILAAEYAVEKQLPLVVARYKQGSSEGVVKILNYDLYKKGVNPGNTKLFEKFVKGTRCLLYKDR